MARRGVCVEPVRTMIDSPGHSLFYAWVRHSYDHLLEHTKSVLLDCNGLHVCVHEYICVSEYVYKYYVYVHVSVCIIDMHKFLEVTQFCGFCASEL